VAMIDRQEAKVRDVAQAHLGDRVLGAAILVPKGRAMTAASFGLVEAVVQPTFSNPADGFASYNLFAVTERSLHVFESAGLTVKVKSSIGSWPWGAFGATVDGHGITRTLVLHWSDGSESELEAHIKGTQRFQLAVLGVIADRASAGRGQHPSVA
jgi:hypothetical protein